MKSKTNNNKSKAPNFKQIFIKYFNLITGKKEPNKVEKKPKKKVRRNKHGFPVFY